CGGEIRVFVEQLGEITRLARALHDEAPIAEATVIAASDALPELLGTRLLVLEGGESSGTTGHSALDSLIVETPRALLARGDSGTRTFPLSEGDTIEVFFAVYPAPPTLIVVGAGHISIPLTRLAKVLDYRVIVVDAREAFATRERLPEADELLLEWPDEALEHLPLTGATAVAVLTHDAKVDVPALRVALQSPASYVGAIGSRGTRERRNERLREAGVTDEQISRIYGPIGLDIGARTPEEIALAILAQVVAVRQGQSVAHR